jgi:hypothetical protein
MMVVIQILNIFYIHLLIIYVKIIIIVKDLNDSGIHNALLCSTKNPYIIKLVEECINNIELEYYGYN